MPLEFTYHVEPDEHGVFDGRELARQLIGNAYRLLVPYVKACPACADSLFSAIANRTIEELHQEAREKGTIGGFSMSARTGDERQAGVDAHLKSATAATAQLLREATGTNRTSTRADNRPCCKSLPFCYTETPVANPLLFLDLSCSESL